MQGLTIQIKRISLKMQQVLEEILNTQVILTLGKEEMVLILEMLKRYLLV